MENFKQIKPISNEINSADNDKNLIISWIKEKYWYEDDIKIVKLINIKNKKAWILQIWKIRLPFLGDKIIENAKDSQGNSFVVIDTFDVENLKWEIWCFLLLHTWDDIKFWATTIWEEWFIIEELLIDNKIYRIKNCSFFKDWTWDFSLETKEEPIETLRLNEKNIFEIYYYYDELVQFKTKTKENVPSNSQLDLNKALRNKFASFSNDRLISKINSSKDFENVDEKNELSRRLKEEWKRWYWKEINGAEKVCINEPYHINPNYIKNWNTDAINDLINDFEWDKIEFKNFVEWVLDICEFYYQTPQAFELSKQGNISEFEAHYLHPVINDKYQEYIDGNLDWDMVYFLEKQYKRIPWIVIPSDSEIFHKSKTFINDVLPKSKTINEDAYLEIFSKKWDWLEIHVREDMDNEEGFVITIDVIKSEDKINATRDVNYEEIKLEWLKIDLQQKVEEFILNN